MIRSTITAAAVLALLAPATPAVADPLQLDTAQAAATYLAAACPVNSAFGKFTRAYHRYDSRDGIGDRPNKHTRAAAKRLSSAFAAGARKLTDPAYAWPEAVASDVQAVAVDFYQDAAIAKAISGKRYRWDGSDWVQDADRVAGIRLALGLPPSGGC